MQVCNIAAVLLGIPHMVIHNMPYKPYKIQKFLYNNHPLTSSKTKNTGQAILCRPRALTSLHRLVTIVESTTIGHKIVPSHVELYLCKSLFPFSMRLVSDR